jgi:hypothetical protein
MNAMDKNWSNTIKRIWLLYQGIIIKSSKAVLWHACVKLQSATYKRKTYTCYTARQNLTFFSSHEEKYLILIVLLTLNSNMLVVFLHHPLFFFYDGQVKCEKMCIFTYFTGQQNLTFFWHTEENICS